MSFVLFCASASMEDVSVLMTNSKPPSKRLTSTRCLIHPYGWRCLRLLSVPRSNAKIMLTLACNISVCLYALIIAFSVELNAFSIQGGTFKRRRRAISLDSRFSQFHTRQRLDLCSFNSDATQQDEVEKILQDAEFMERTKKWVVLVDDEPAIRQAVGDYLYDQGYQITACADADAMLEICAKPQGDGQLPAVPDAIVSDVRMPGKDGLELLRLIRADERLERVPVILLTAKGMTQDRIAGYRAGADVYLPKPFIPEELLSIIDNVILRRQQMTGDKGKLVDLKADMGNIKQLLRRNGSKVVKATDVYLTPVERDTLDLLCKGYTNGEIAEERGVSVIGVNRMIQKMYLTTRTQTRTELVRWAIETGYVSRRT